MRRAGGERKRDERKKKPSRPGQRQKKKKLKPLPSFRFPRTITGRPVVFPAHMEIATPSIADAVASCVAAGATRVVIAPYFLSQGRHIAEDVPALAAEAAAAHAGALPGGVVVSRALGGDEMLARLLEARVAESMAGGEEGT